MPIIEIPLSVSTGGGGGTGTVTPIQQSYNVDNTIATNKQITLPSTPLDDTLLIAHNGLVMSPGGSNDYTRSGTLVTFTAGVTLTVGDVIYAQYLE